MENISIVVYNLFVCIFKLTKLCLKIVELIDVLVLRIGHAFIKYKNTKLKLKIW